VVAGVGDVDLIARTGAEPVDLIEAGRRADAVDITAVDGRPATEEIVPSGATLRTAQAALT
jgi:hypothetical protein